MVALLDQISGVVLRKADISREDFLDDMRWDISPVVKRELKGGIPVRRFEPLVGAYLSHDPVFQRLPLKNRQKLLRLEAWEPHINAQTTRSGLKPPRPAKAHPTRALL